MATAKQLRDARARVREVRQTIKAGQAAERAANARTEAPAKKLNAIRARLAKQPILTQAAAREQRHITVIVGPTRIETLDAIGLGWAGDRSSGPEMAKRLSSGETKVQLAGSSVPYTLGGMLQRSRVTTPARLAAIRKAEAAYDRAKKSLEARAKALVSIYAEAFEAGEKPDKAAIVDALAREFAISVQPKPTDAERQAIEDGREASRDLADAEKHLRWHEQDEATFVKDPLNTVWVDGKGQVQAEVKPVECPCRECGHDRSEREKQAKETARLDALPTVMYACPRHKRRHRVAVDRRNVTITREVRDMILAKTPVAELTLPEPKVGQTFKAGQGWIDDEPKPSDKVALDQVPVLWCRVEKKVEPLLFLNEVALVKEQAAAAKAKAREEREAAKAGKKRVKVIHADAAEGDTIRFTCPDCGDEQEQVVEDGEDGLLVACDTCEQYRYVAALNYAVLAQAA